MKCKVQGVFKNLRYRILTINGEEYILDLWNSFWKIIFPFLFWIFPTSVFKVDEPNIVEKLKASNESRTKTGNTSMLGAGVGVFLASVLKPLSDYLAIPGSPIINAVILLVIVLFTFVLCMYINKMLKRKLYDIVNIKNLSTNKLWIKPKSVKHFFKVVVIYFFFLALTLLFFMMSIKDPDAVTLIFTMIAMFFLLLSSAGPVAVGATTVKFKDGKKQSASAK